MQGYTCKQLSVILVDVPSYTEYMKQVKQQHFHSMLFDRDEGERICSALVQTIKIVDGF